MKTKIYMGLGFLIVLLICISLGLLIRKPDTKPKNVYRDVDPSQKVDHIYRQDSKDNPPPAEQGSDNLTYVSNKKSNQGLPDNFSNSDEVFITGSDSNKIDDEDVKRVNGIIPYTENGKVVMSKYGLGPIPKIPDGWPGRQKTEHSSLDHELIWRVMLKKFEVEGTYYPGATMSNSTGLVRLTSKDKIYASWSIAYINGEPVKYISGMSAHSETGNQIRANAKARQAQTPEEFRHRIGRPLILEEDIPTGVEIVSFDNSGIDPYEYLNLKRQ